MEEDTARRERPATRNDVARLSGVSTAVVSYVLNDGPRPVAEATRKRVLAAIAELNYRPNAAARAFRLQKTNTLGLLVPDISNPFFAELAKSVQNAAFPRGYAVTFADSENDPGHEREQIRSMAGRQVDGILMIGRTPQADLTPLTEASIPLVAFDRFEGDRGTPTVVIDDFQAARAGVEHLRSHGHERIALIGGPADQPAARARHRAWAELTAPSRTDLDRLVVKGEYSRSGGHRAARELLERDLKATAVFISSDIQAIGALRAFDEAGARVPEDLAVLSFDGTQESEFSSPPMTVIRQPLETMASTALDLLLDADARSAGIHRVVPHELVVRESCGCLSPR